MTPREWTTVDKSGWGPGPWQDEPDKIHWIDEATDLDCLMNRGPAGAWCGYVAVAEGHPLFGVDYNDAHLRACVDDRHWDHDDCQPDVHGGLTYSAFCRETDDESRGVCHVPLPGRPHRVWWFGFDCAHAYDVTPATEARERALGLTPLRFGGETYRDRAYVEREIARLARQLAAMTTTTTAPDARRAHEGSATPRRAVQTSCARRAPGAPAADGLGA